MHLYARRLLSAQFLMRNDRQSIEAQLDNVENCPKERETGARVSGGRVLRGCVCVKRELLQSCPR